MQQRIEPTATGPKSLRDAMQRASRLRAVIRDEADQIIIEFSDGRVHLLKHAGSVTTDQLIVAAVQWCRRHGAGVVEISS